MVSSPHPTGKNNHKNAGKQSQESVFLPDLKSLLPECGRIPPPHTHIWKEKGIPPCTGGMDLKSNVLSAFPASFPTDFLGKLAKKISNGDHMIIEQPVINVNRLPRA